MKKLLLSLLFAPTLALARPNSAFAPLPQR